MCVRERERRERGIKRPVGKTTQHVIFTMAVLQVKNEGQKERMKPIPIPVLIETLILK